MRRLRLLLTALLPLAAATPALAQEYETARRAWTFFGQHLDIEVTADGPGALQVVRGERGRLEVAGHADQGLTAFGLGGFQGDRLRLSAVGAYHASYVVVVPERVSVTVLLPGHSQATRVDDADPVLRWDGATEVQRPASTIEPAADGLFLVLHADAAPAFLELVQAAVRRVEVRTDGDRFRVRSSEPLAFRPGPPGAGMTLNTGERAIDLVVTLPRGTRFFQLRSDGDILLDVREQLATTPCQRSIRVSTAEGQRFEFHPDAGRLRCR